MFRAFVCLFIYKWAEFVWIGGCGTILEESFVQFGAARGRNVSASGLNMTLNQSGTPGDDH